MIRFILAILLVLPSAIAFAVKIQPDRHYTLTDTQYIQLHSMQTGQDHELIVFLPGSYATSKDKHYPVLYFADGYWDMPLLSATHGNLRYDNMTPELIMVGFSYPDGKDYGVERERDLTPLPTKPGSGGSGNFYQFLTETVVPLIEKNYRAAPGLRALAGESYGGLFVLTSMYRNPAFFKRYIAISPGIASFENYVTKLDYDYAKQHKSLDAYLYVSYGDAEYAPFREPIIRFQKQLAAHNYKGLKLKNAKLEGLRHTTVKGEGYVKGLIWVWQDLAPTGPSGLERGMRAENADP